MGLPSLGHAGQSTQAGFFDSQIWTLLWLGLPFYSRRMPDGIHVHMTDTSAARRGPIIDAMSIQLSPWSPGVPSRMDCLPSAPHPPNRDLNPTVSGLRKQTLKARAGDLGPEEVDGVPGTSTSHFTSLRHNFLVITESGVISLPPLPHLSFTPSFFSLSVWPQLFRSPLNKAFHSLNFLGYFSWSNQKEITFACTEMKSSV